MSALSRLDTDPSRSTRFELFYKGLELGNGFFELNQSVEQRSRFELANQQRQQMGKQTWLLDERFLEALDQLPDCAGIALGIDRILMIQQAAGGIDEVLAFPFDQS